MSVGESDEELQTELLKPTNIPGDETEVVLVKGKDKDSYGFSQLIKTKAGKNVVAPYLKTLRKLPKKPPDVVEYESEAARMKAVSYLKERLSVTVQVLQVYTTAENINLPGVLYETIDTLKNVTDSSEAILYMVDTAGREIYYSQRYIQNPRHKVNWRVSKHSNVASHVAATKKFVWCGDILADPRFSHGVGWSGCNNCIS